MKSLVIILLVLVTARGLWASEKEDDKSEPTKEIVRLDQLPPGISEILRKLITLKKDQRPEALLPYWANGKMALSLPYHGSDTITVRQKDTEQDGAEQAPTAPESK